MKKNENYTKESIKRQRIDRQRALRVVKYIEYPFILPDSPVELEEGYIVSDRETCDVFASFVFKNISSRPIRKLNIRIDCYLNQNIPYTHIDFTYSQEELTFGLIEKNGTRLKLRDANAREYIEKSESFGYCVFIPIPETYFKKLDVILVSAEYAGGQVEVLNTLVAGDTKRYSELDNISKLVYSRVNIYHAAEENFPTTVIPQFGNKVWLCCCGNKNPNDAEVCEKCKREKEWQKNSVTAEILEETTKNMVSDPRENTLHDKSKFKQNKFLESDAEQQKKIEQYEKAMRNIAAAERRRERRQVMLIPKILLIILAVLALWFFIRVVLEFWVEPESGADGGVKTENVGNAQDIMAGANLKYFDNLDIIYP